MCVPLSAAESDPPDGPRPPDPAPANSAASNAIEPANAAHPALGARPLPAAADAKPAYNWRGLLVQSGMFMAIQHSYRLGDQDYTRKALKGPFFRDYINSIKGIRGWNDGDSYLANYIGHPIQGSASGFIQVQNDPEGRMQEFGRNSKYWKSRMRAMGWNAVFSTFYEIGPLGEAAIGNVGLRPGTKGAVDLVITPTLGTAWQVTEDMLDRFLVRRVEDHTNNRFFILITRGALNPTRSFANMLRFKAPWHRDMRPGIRALSTRPR